MTLPAGNEPAAIVLAVEGVIFFLLDMLPVRCSNASLGPLSLIQTDSLLPFTEDSETEKGNNCDLRHSRMFHDDVTQAKVSGTLQLK